MRVLVLLLLLASFVSAFDVNVFPSERSIKMNESAVFEVELSHNSSSAELFEVYSDVTWDVRPESILSVGSGQVLKTGLFVRPLNLNSGSYNVPVFFKRVGSVDEEKRVLYVELLSPFPDDATFLPAVRGVVDVFSDVDPRKGLTIKLSLENQNRRILDRVDVKVRSSILNKDYTTSLGPLEKKSLTFIAELDKTTPPQKGVLQVSVIVPEQDKAYQFDLVPVSFEVVPFGGVVPSVSSVSSFFKSVDTVTLVNEGNRPLSHVYRVSGSSLFVSGSPEPGVVDGVLAWEFRLGAGESVEFLVVRNYRPLFLFVLVSVICGFCYFVFRSPIVVKKRASVVSSFEGGVSELKVIVELYNRGGRLVRHLKVMDLAPRLADVQHDVTGTILAPSKVVPHENGTLLRWEIDMMDPKEHRILMYRIRTKLEVLGGMSLPVTAVKFFVEGHERETVSNKPVIRFRS